MGALVVVSGLPGAGKSTLARRVKDVVEAGVRLVVLVCTYNDHATHRRRLDGCQHGIPGWPELSSDDVERNSERAVSYVARATA